MHVTLRVRHGLPSLRSQRVRKKMQALIRRVNDEGFQIVYWSIQRNHFHLIPEAKSREIIARKMQGFAISFAKWLNKVLGGRRGKVFEDRYFRRDIEDSRQLRNVLTYVFHNAKKHGEIPRDAATFDLYSNAWHFDGWDVDTTGLDIEGDPRASPWTRMLRKRWWWGPRLGNLKLRGAPAAVSFASPAPVGDAE